MDPDRSGRPGGQFLNRMPAAPRGELAELQPNSRAVASRRAAPPALTLRRTNRIIVAKGLVMELAHPANSSWISDMVARKNLPARKPRAPVAWVPRGATTMSGRKQAAPRNAFGRAAAPPRQLALSQRRNLPKPRSRMPNPQRPAEDSSPPQSQVPSRRGKPARPPRPDAPPLIERTRRKRPPQKPNLWIHPLRRPRSRGASQRRKRPAPRSRPLPPPAEAHPAPAEAPSRISPPEPPPRR